MFLARAVLRLSSRIAAVERVILMLLIAAIATFVLSNVLLRMIGITIAWADEIAIYSMILSGFVGASLMLRGRKDPAVLLLHEVLGGRGVRMLRVTVSAVCLMFAATLAYLCWRWFDPLTLAGTGFDVGAFQGATFNFVYTDTTPVMGVPSFLFYLVMPWFAATLTVHAAANLVEDLGLLDPVDNPAGIAELEI